MADPVPEAAPAVTASPLPKIEVYQKPQHSEYTLQIQQVGAEVKWKDASVKWEASDWLGLCLLLIVVAFIVTGFLAIRRGTQPARVMTEFGKALKAALRLRSN